MRSICHPLIIVNPEKINNETLVTSNVPEDDYPLYDEGVTYGEGERVMDPISHIIWESLDEENKGNEPEKSPTKWLNIGLTNKWKVFDDKVSSKTSHPDEITYTLRFTRIVNSLAVLNLESASKVTVSIQYLGEVVYVKEYNVGHSLNFQGWYNWFFGNRRLKKNMIEMGLPTFPGAEITIKIEGGETLGVGMIILGQQRRMGYGIKYGASGGTMSYSRVQRDPDTGEVELFKRPSAKRSRMTLIMPESEADTVHHFLDEIESVPVLLVGNELYEMFVGYGIVKNFEVVIPDFSEAECVLEFEGFI